MCGPAGPGEHAPAAAQPAPAAEQEFTRAIQKELEDQDVMRQLLQSVVGQRDKHGTFPQWTWVCSVCGTCNMPFENSQACAGWIRTGPSAVRRCQGSRKGTFHSYANPDEEFETSGRTFSCETLPSPPHVSQPVVSPAEQPNWKRPLAATTRYLSAEQREYRAQRYYDFKHEYQNAVAAKDLTAAHCILSQEIEPILFSRCSQWNMTKHNPTYYADAACDLICLLYTSPSPRD